MKRLFLTALLVLVLTQFGFSIKDARLLRFPDINNDLIAFVYAGDIWTVPAQGGDANRLTSHMGLELFPKISPDGRWIAFSGEYSGSRQIYIISSEGGEPRQLTFYNDVGEMPPRGGWDYVVMDWTGDSKNILVRANRTPFGERMGKYFLVNIEGGFEKPLQIPEAGFGTFSPDEKKIVYTPISREFRTWKRYKGGRAQDVWIYDLENDTSKRLTTFPGTDQHPIWYKDKIYFVSDQDMTLNVWSYDLNTGVQVQVTQHKDFDVLWPAGANGRIAYENGGYIYTLDLDSGKYEKVTVNLNFDNPHKVPYFKNVSEFTTRYGNMLNHDGSKSIFDARGDLFVVPANGGSTVNLTRTQGIREFYPVCSPDGKKLAYISDKTGDYEIYTLDLDNPTKVEQLTQGHKVWKFPVLWSPDGKMILFYDMNQKLQILDVQTRLISIVDTGDRDYILNFEWSPDSKWVVYDKNGENYLDSIWIYSLVDKKTLQVTTSRYNDYSPTFSKCGKYIFFLSDRDFNMSFQSGFSALEFDYVYPTTTRMYALALVKDAPSLFKDAYLKHDKSDKKKDDKDKDSDKDGKDKGKSGDKGKDKDKKEIVSVKIDFDGIQDRIEVFPLVTDEYGAPTDVGEKVLYRKGRQYRLYDLETFKDKVVIENVRGLAVSADKKKFLVKSGDTWAIIDTKDDQKLKDNEISLENVQMKIDPEKEWQQIYNEAWRLYRDWFYVENMHNVDWEKMRQKYASLVPYIGHRADLDFILGELMAELNVGHAYINWGDFDKVKRVETGLLGAELEADPVAGRYKIKKIYKGENWNERTRSPLTEQHVKVNEGDYIISLNGYAVTIKDNPYQFLENTAGKEIPIVVNSRPEEKGSRTYTIKPIVSELELFYMDWVESRRQMVDRLSNNRIGYIHVPDTAFNGNRELFKGIYAFSNKDAFIIDDRYNGGGFSPAKMIDKLGRHMDSFWRRRGQELSKEPDFALEGPMVMLINHYSSSGGDNFPYVFRKHNLGILIGTRTWGGLVGYSWSPSLVDGPSMAIPMTGIVSTDGQYTVEGTGVSPDEGYEVYDRPEEIVKGHDPCIEKAVEYLLKELEKNPPKKVKTPADPDRVQWHEDFKK